MSALNEVMARLPPTDGKMRGREGVQARSFDKYPSEACLVQACLISQTANQRPCELPTAREGD